MPFVLFTLVLISDVVHGEVWMGWMFEKFFFFFVFFLSLFGICMYIHANCFLGSRNNLLRSCGTDC